MAEIERFVREADVKPTCECAGRKCGPHRCWPSLIYLGIIGIFVAGGWITGSYVDGEMDRLRRELADFRGSFAETMTASVMAAGQHAVEQAVGLAIHDRIRQPLIQLTSQIEAAEA